MKPPGPPWFGRWLERRVPPARSVVLDNRRIFILPSPAGWWFVVMLVVMLLAAINYQNNMVFGLTFLLGSLLIVTVLHTWANLAGLHVEAVRALPTFAGEPAEFELHCNRRAGRGHYDIAVAWPGQTPQLFSLAESSDIDLVLHVPTRRRGRLRPGRLRIETVYPLGLLRAWSWLDLDIEALVWPRPVAAKRQPVATSAAAGESAAPSIGSEEFDGFRVYRPGDPLRHAFWKSYARGLPLQVKQFAELKTRRHLLDWEDFGGDTERRLAALCHEVLQLEAAGEEYGIRLPGREIENGGGEAQRARALRALALFGEPTP